ncbi:hypothetical protein U1Q18_013960 [Sarracenia purpurea var. burkii]
MVVAEILPGPSNPINKVNSRPRPQAAFDRSRRIRRSTVGFDPLSVSPHHGRSCSCPYSPSSLRKAALRGERDRGGGRKGKVVALTSPAMVAARPSSAKSSPPTRTQRSSL